MTILLRGVKLWVDDKLLIDQWYDETLREGVYMSCRGTDRKCSHENFMPCENSQGHSVIKSDPKRKKKKVECAGSSIL